MYKIQSSRYCSGWEDEDSGIDISFSFEDVLKIAKDLDHYDGKYSYRIVDDGGWVLWTSITPYEPVYLDLGGPAVEWLEELRESYSLTREEWCYACKSYLEKYDKEQKEDA